MSAKQPARVLFFGMQCAFSLPILTAMVESGSDVCAMVLPLSPLIGSTQPAIRRREQSRAMRSPLVLANMPAQSSLMQLAWTRQIPVWEVHRLSDPETIATLAAYQPDIICVACFPRRIPRVIRELARLGCLNVHPSLLPHNRGPVPLFWEFREGHKTTGVTVHLMEEEMDSGDILVQEAIEIPDGISYGQLELRCALRGGVLLVRAIRELYEGCAIRTSQDQMQSSEHSFPTHEDFVVSVEEWDARHVYNFICGVGGWDGPVELCLGGGEHLSVQEAISYSLENVEANRDEPSSKTGEEVVRCKAGWVKVRIVHV